MSDFQYYEEDCDPFYEECAPYIPPVETQEEVLPFEERFIEYYPFSPLCSVVAGFMNFAEYQDYKGDGRWAWRWAYLFEMGTGFGSLTLWFLREDFPWFAYLDNLSSIGVQFFNLAFVKRA